MPPHLSIERLVVDLRLFCSQGNRAFVFNEQTPEVILFATKQPLLKGKFPVTRNHAAIMSIHYSLRRHWQIYILNQFGLAFDYSALENILKFSDVTWPTVGQHLIQDIGRDL